MTLLNIHNECCPKINLIVGKMYMPISGIVRIFLFGFCMGFFYRLYNITTPENRVIFEQVMAVMQPVKTSLVQSSSHLHTLFL